jgi:TonB family protein
VIGGGIPTAAAGGGDRPFVSLKEATALRTHDFFPRLPAAAWTERHPYVVVIDLCVSEEGQVTDATLVSARSARFDALVLEAVRGWRYQTRLVDGQPRPFCHQVVIRYDLP